MTHASIRARALATLRADAAAAFATDPDLRSVMLLVAQYFCDEGEDQTHVMTIGSTRAVPLWPTHYDPRQGDECPVLDGELRWIDTNLERELDDDELLCGFAAYCHEHGSQSENASANYLPFAIARRRGEPGGAVEVEVEVVGNLERFHTELFADGDALELELDELETAEQVTARGPDRTFDEPRARALFEQVCAHPFDDDHRRVLADHLLEQDDPRGELIALELAPAPDPAARARRDELLATHKRRWIRPIDAIAPLSVAHFERGFLARVRVWSRDPAELAALASAPAWRTLEALAIMPGSGDFITPNMRALREVGPLGAAGLATIADAAEPWAIETLGARVDDDQAIAALHRATTLPRLRHLTVYTSYAARAAASLSTAPWWAQLERLTIATPAPRDMLPTWHALHAELGVPWLAIVQLADDTFGDPSDAPTGWEIAFGPDDACAITQCSWSATASLGALVALMTQLPAHLRVRLVPSRYWAPDAIIRQTLLELGADAAFGLEVDPAPTR